MARIPFDDPQTKAHMVEIIANHFKNKRKSRDNPSQHFLFPFGNFENGDPARTNLWRGEYLVDEPERRFFARMEVLQINTFSMS